MLERIQGPSVEDRLDVPVEGTHPDLQQGSLSA